MQMQVTNRLIMKVKKVGMFSQFKKLSVKIENLLASDRCSKKNNRTRRHRFDEKNEILMCVHADKTTVSSSANK